jgi:hypothetical protein
MYVRCAHCGYDNSPEYRFCGMCGASLARAAAPAKPLEKQVAGNGGNGNTATENVHGPSFLGLAEDPKVEFHYLYEDEQPKSHVGLVVFILILLCAAVALGWQYQHNGFPFDRLHAGGGGGQSASSSEVSPAQSQDQATHIEKPMTGAGDVLPTQPDQKTPSDTGKTTDVPVENGQAGTPPNNASGANGNSSTAAGAAANNSSAEKTTAKSASKTRTDNASASNTQEADATPPADVPAKSRAPKAAARAPKPSPAAPAAAAVPGSQDADLELAGERYLYGNGLPQNCTRAESNLRTAATHGNAKAETVLGTMYATGHCVGRDLPTAYRWFARALHQEPQNSRISDDLQVLWRQMTPQEKQLATSSGQ